MFVVKKANLKEIFVFINNNSLDYIMFLFLNLSLNIGHKNE